MVKVRERDPLKDSGLDTERYTVIASDSHATIPWITGAIGDGLGIGFAIGSLGVWCLAISLGSEGARRDLAQRLAARVP